MTPTTIAAFVSVALCLPFAETRWMGIVAVGVLGYLYSLSLVVAAVMPCWPHALSITSKEIERCFSIVRSVRQSTSCWGGIYPM